MSSFATICKRKLYSKFFNEFYNSFSSFYKRDKCNSIHCDYAHCDNRNDNIKKPFYFRLTPDSIFHCDNILENNKENGYTDSDKFLNMCDTVYVFEKHKQ